jgi:hypothetical protein
MSRKSNPLVLRYGRVQLTFTRPPSAKSTRLQDILVNMKTEIDYQPLPAALEFEDFPLREQPTKSFFLRFARNIECAPISEGAVQIQYASGVTASFDGDFLSSLRLSKRHAIEGPSAPIANDREPLIPEIDQMIEEAIRADNAMVPRAALLITWAALEAILRRAALMRSITGRTSSVPQMLIRELFNDNYLTASEMRLLEEARQVRMAAAHGLSAPKPSPALLRSLISLAKTLLVRPHIR